MTMILKKEEGFDGERRIIVPPVVVEQYKANPISNSFNITDIGYYPKAMHHFCKRTRGCREHILIHCVDGKGAVIVDGQRHHLAVNEFILIPAEKKHFYKADEHFPWTIYWMHFGGTQAPVVADRIYGKVLKQNNTLIMGEQHIELFNRMYNLLLQGYAKENFEFIALSLPYFLSGYLFSEKFNDVSGLAEHDVVEKAIAFLKANLSRKITLTDISSHVCLSVSHFSKLFKHKTGYSPIEYLNHLKIQRACHLLQFSDKRISEISLEIGFDDQYYFSRLFKEHMTVSPTVYRNNLEQRA
ncbi:helix-turn-helix domain-containing protein [Parapedobacter koreensis]|uniref:AraC-like ligand binding domain-containing protein n=1 Tax=Parapedobacter koreensis TaxID=332977 RepID=A0A1H7SK10_9SPHI|nr:AraC family transcriptional regulator [Parapedobacter koreensis]SEL72942.1 AraC-like ligand binding domain-containing protein [Parapedobacter koreensis]